MAKLPDAVDQVLQMHAPFIHAVVNALTDRAQLPQLMQTLSAAEQQGWPELVDILVLGEQQAGEGTGREGASGSSKVLDGAAAGAEAAGFWSV